MLKKLLLTHIVSYILGLNLYGQENISWEVLSDVQWSEQTDSISGYDLMVADFGEKVIQYHDQVIYISGYVIPLDAMNFSYALSRNSYAACFFCGQAGPETVMDLYIKPKSIPSQDLNNTLLKFKGTLILKKINPSGFNYQLVNAELIK